MGTNNRRLTKREADEKTEARMHYELLCTNADGSNQEMLDAYFDLRAFFAENEDLDPEDANAIFALSLSPVGSEHRMGGGAAPIFIVRVVADEDEDRGSCAVSETCSGDCPSLDDHERSYGPERG